MRRQSVFYVLLITVLGVIIFVNFHSILDHDTVGLSSHPLLGSGQTMGRAASLQELNRTLELLHEELQRLKSYGFRTSQSDRKTNTVISASNFEKNLPQITDNQGPGYLKSISNKKNQIMKELPKVVSTKEAFDGETSAESDLQLPTAIRTNLKAVIFTMDSISSYEANSQIGGAAGEIRIRRSLENAFKHFGVETKIARSDEEFNAISMNDVDFILVDPWTWAAKGWVPKPNLRGFEDRIFVLDFFGSRGVKGNVFHINPKKILTAFKSPFNTFLGYYMDDDAEVHLKGLESKRKKDQGVIWGKDHKHFKGKETMLLKVANHVPLISTANRLLDHPNITWLGHQTSDQWMSLLSQSKFLLGLGNPLLGPSAVDAVAMGCMFLNPKYEQPMLEAHYVSQHPYITEQFPDAVCTFDERDVNELLICVNKALNTVVKPRIPKDLRKVHYFQRVQAIFDL